MKDHRPDLRFLELLNISLLLFTGFVLAAIYLSIWSAALAIPYAIDYEGPIIWGSQQILDGKNIYSPTSLVTSPWVVTLVQPVFLILGSLLLKIFGPLLWPFRMACMLGLIASATALYRTVRLSGVPQLAAWASLFFFLSAGPVATWSYTAKTDMVAAALSFWAIERFVGWWLNHEPAQMRLWSLMPVILLSVLGLFTKQEAIVVPPAIFAFLLTQGLPRLAFLYLGTGAVMVASIAGVIQLLTSGYCAHQTYFSHLGCSLDWIWINVHQLGDNLFSLAAGLLILLVGYLFKGHFFKSSTESDVPPETDLALRNIRLRNLRLWLPWLLLLCCLPINVYHLAIPFSNVNGLISSIFALSFCVAITLSGLPAIFLTIVLCLSLFAGHSLKFVVWASADTLINTAARLKAAQLFGKEVLTEDNYLNMVTGSKVVMVDCASFHAVWKTQMRNWKPLVEAITNKKYAAIIIATRRTGDYLFWPDEIIWATRKNYTFAGYVMGNGRDLEMYLPVQKLGEYGASGRVGQPIGLGAGLSGSK